ncbi:ribonuclease domain-containing protein [Tersicoccus solisilvae]|uniref:ribonuclease domain-containing protein n=1 Tax=Tersicoccus solisilvae TaxID=1882339 RepID=UPI001E295E7B|nr:ribonuclease domain-containing protein [Tersicoccus solisilvae]
MRRRGTGVRRVAAAGAAIAAVLIAVLLAGCLATGTSGPSGSTGQTAVATGPGTPAGGTPRATGRDPVSGLAVVAASTLPAEARRTIDLIHRGGPFPYEEDGSTFGNFERLLPARPRGHYREYTVRTPGESDRGARRIVAARDGALYWTTDHYASFRVIAEDR